MKHKEFADALITVQQYLMSDDEITMVSVHKSGIIKIVFDASMMSGSDCVARMQEFGISGFSWTTDLRSNSIFMTVKP